MIEFVSAADTRFFPAWVYQPVTMLLVLVGLIALSIFAGRALAKWLRSDVHAPRLGLIFAVIAVSAFAVLLNWPPRFGVDLRGGITIIGQLRQDVERVDEIDVKNMIPQLIARVDPSGTQEIMIRALGTDKIEVVIPDVDMEEAMRIWDRMTKAGELKFRIVADRNYHPTLISRALELIDHKVADTIVREKKGEAADNRSGPIKGRWYELAHVDPSEAQEGVLPFKFMPDLTHLVRNGKTKQIISVQQFRGSPVEFATWADEQKISRVEILCVEPEGPDDITNMEGEHLRAARAGSDDYGRPAVNFDMTREGKRRMGALTSRNLPDGSDKKLLAIISDGKLITAPSINSTITDSGIIEGRFTNEEVNDLVINLKAGKMEVALAEHPISMDYQQSTIGEEIKRKGVFSCIVSLILVAGFMSIYYGFGGMIAGAVLALNLLLLLAVVMIIKQPLTLTGLAGIALTTGMSIDANVLICERIRDELAKGTALRMAIRNGYDRAMSTIIDTNLTTFLTGSVLYVLGTEQLRGFAVTLCLGIIISMFTAVYCSRVVMELAERNKWIRNLRMLSIFPGGVFDFLGKRRSAYVLSFVVIAVGIFACAFRGSEIFDHDLRGGSTARIVLRPDADLNVEAIRDRLNQYDGKISDREEVQFTVAKINSEEFPDRVFKIDSNIPIWDKPEPAPYQSMEQTLLDLLGTSLMQLRMDYDPARLQISKVSEGSESSGSEPSDGANSSDGATPVESGATGDKPGALRRMPWTLGSGLWLATTGHLVYTEPLISIAGGPQDTPAPQQETKVPASDATPSQEPDASKQSTEISVQDAPAQNPPAQDPDLPAGQEPAESMMGSTDRFVAKTDLTFAPPITRGSLINAILDAAESTDQVSLEREDITVTAPGLDPEDLSVKSNAWTVAIEVARADDARRVLEVFQSDYNGKPYFPTVSGVGGQVAAETQWRAVAAIFASLIGVVLYVWVRFQSVAFGLGAVVGLIHNVLVTLGAIAISYWLAPYFGFLLVENFRISLPVIAAFLTLIGYSINDTIVVFDRIREVRGKRPDLTQEMVNISISQTLSRTIITSTLYIMSVVVLYFLGGESIHAFAFALAVGIVVGPYSSIFIATPVALWLVNRTSKKKPTLKSAA